MTVDLNCDMGEGLANDALLMPYISSANIACGYHAGNETIMKRTIETALLHDVAIGAHPGFNDVANFGRTEMRLPLQQVYDWVAEQIFLLTKIARESGTKLQHVKPHGALYNMSAKDWNLAEVIAKAVYDADKTLLLFGLSGSVSISAAESVGVTTVSEVFADRTYQDDGSLTPRSEPGALITDESISMRQVLQMIQEQTVTSIHQKPVRIKAQTICLHGDGAKAVDFARLIHQTLQTHSIGIRRIKI